MLDDLDLELTGHDRVELAKELTEEIFPVDSWTEHEIDLLDRLGILWYFNLE